MAKQSAQPLYVDKPVPKLSAWRQFAVLFAHELRLETHTLDMLGSMGVYAALVLVVFAAALKETGTSAIVPSASGGLVWALLVFTSILGFNRSYLADREENALGGLLLAPVDRSVIYLAKASANLVFLCLVELLICPVYYFFFLADNKPVLHPSWFLLSLLVGSVGITAVGTLLASITSSTKSKDVLMTVLFVPVIFPLLYTVVRASSLAMLGDSDAGSGYIVLMAVAGGYDVVMTAVSWLLYDYVISS
ncbi:MAG: heme exporter protein CcmB [Coriobacteriia bacterium]|nr:heme exporter protein CcmB [Coriobacteriia bacterium]